MSESEREKKKNEVKKEKKNLASFSFRILACSSSSAICCVLVRKVSFDDCNCSIMVGSVSGEVSAFAIALIF